MVTTDDLVSYWKLDEASGNNIDAHGANDGTVTGATYGAAGKINDSMTYDGTGDRTDVGDIINAPADLSISAWVYPTTNGDGGIITQTGGVGDRVFYLWLSNAGLMVEFGIYNDAQVLKRGYKYDGTNYPCPVNTWTHIVGVFDGTADTVKIYVNGTVSGNSGSGFSGTMKDTANAVLIGDSAVANMDIAARIDEVAVFTRVLSQSDIDDLYNSGAGLAYPFTVGTNMKINIADVFKDIDSIQINIGNSWKDVVEIQQNIGDSWKTVF